MCQRGSYQCKVSRIISVEAASRDRNKLTRVTVWNWLILSEGFSELHLLKSFIQKRSEIIQEIKRDSNIQR